MESLKNKYYLAIDLGAFTGRHIVGYFYNGEIKLEEIYRFKTEMDDSPDGLVWNVPRILEEIKRGIAIAFKKYQTIESLSIDTWGADYVLMNGDKEVLPYYAYRNERCLKSAQKCHKSIEFKELYKQSGIQFLSFNTIYQLLDDKEKNRLDNITDYLMMPSYFVYKLTGIKTHEYTDESTTGLLNPFTKEYNHQLTKKLGLPKYLFNDIKQPNCVVGELLPSIQEEVGGNTKVILGASHDTASAFEAIDVSDDGIILSSGTWSLLGIKISEPIVNEKSLIANFTNEGGIGYIRFLKNVPGMFLPNLLKKETGLTDRDIDNTIRQSKYLQTFDVNDTRLITPMNVKGTLLEMLKDNPPSSDIDLFVSIYRSIAICYKKAIDELEGVTNKKYRHIYVVGGGAKNSYLNDLIKEYTNLNVIALPIEATALGNIKIQIKSDH